MTRILTKTADFTLAHEIHHLFAKPSKDSLDVHMRPKGLKQACVVDPAPRLTQNCPNPPQFDPKLKLYEHHNYSPPAPKVPRRAFRPNHLTDILGWYQIGLGKVNLFKVQGDYHHAQAEARRYAHCNGVTRNLPFRIEPCSAPSFS